MQPFERKLRPGMTKPKKYADYLKDYKKRLKPLRDKRLKEAKRRLKFVRKKAEEEGNPLAKIKLLWSMKRIR